MVAGLCEKFRRRRKTRVLDAVIVTLTVSINDTL